jgi:hypothetical protein
MGFCLVIYLSGLSIYQGQIKSTYIYKEVDGKKVDITRMVNSSVYVKGFFTKGSGTVIKKTKNEMYILTAFHVLRMSVRLNELGKNKTDAVIGYLINGKEIEYPVEVVKYNEKDDLLLLKINKVDENLAVAQLAKEEPEIGTEMYSIGNPQLLNRILCKGILCHKDKEFYITDTTVMGGSSGGGVFNYYGELVGVVKQVPADPTFIPDIYVKKEEPKGETDKIIGSKNIPGIIKVSENNICMSKPLPVIKEFLKGTGIGE